MSGKKLPETELRRDRSEPKYFVDAKEVTREHVADLARSANIVPSNLCQVWLLMHFGISKMTERVHGSKSNVT